MSGLLSRIRRFSRSPQGRRAMHTARRIASDPTQRAKARGFLGRLRGGRRHS